MKYHSLFLFLFFFVSIIYAQSNNESFKANGVVIDLLTSKPLSGASVIISSRVNGKELKGMATDEKGGFNFDNISEGKVRIKFSMVGYQAQVIDSVAIDQSSRLGLIKLFPTAVEIPEVVVKSIKPLIEFHADRQIINIDRLPGNSGTVTEALKNSGLVEVDQSTNKITVRGQGIKIKMDDHEYNMPVEMLSQMPATMLEQVEVILAPGAKESAEGGTYILNLVSKKEAYSNYSGMLSLNVASNDRTFGGTYLNYKANKLNLFAQAFGSKSSNDNEGDNERYVYTSPSMYYQKGKSINQGSSKSGNVKVGFDYDFDDKNTSTFFINYSGFNFSNEGNSNSAMYNNQLIQQYNILSSNKNDNTNSNLSFYGFYKRKFETKGHELVFDAMYTILNNPSESNQKWDYSNKLNRPDLQNGVTDVVAKTFIFKTDYALPINTNKLEAGYNLTARVRNNNYDVENYSYKIKSWMDSLSLSNNFKYYETIHAIYSTYSHKIGKFDAKLGIRAENLSTEGNQLTQNIIFKENYFSLFPNLDLSYKLGEMYQLSINAFRRVTYPQIFYINPFRRFLGTNSYSAGNPKIKPTYTNSVALNFSQYLSLFYNYTTGTITSAMTTENDSTLVSTFLNLNSEKAFGINVTLPYYNSPMMPIHLPDFITTFYISFNYRYAKQSGQFQQEDLSLIEKSYQVNSYLGIKIWWDIDVNFSVNYMPRTETRRMVRSGMTYTSLYMSKSLYDRKLRLSLSIYDLLNASRFYYESIGGNYYTKSNSRMLNSRGISIGISYLFNDYKDRRDRRIDDGRDGGGQNSSM